MAYTSKWERLPEAVRQVMAGGSSEQQAREEICQALSDGALEFRARLKRHSRQMTATNVLENAAFETPAKLSPDDFAWEESRPLEPWTVKRGAFKLPGRWELEWIELCRSDVASVLCAAQVTDNPSEPTGPKPRKAKTRPQRERAQKVLDQLFPGKLPDQSIMPNKMLSAQVNQKLKALRLPPVSDETVLRAAKRRR